MHLFQKENLKFSRLSEPAALNTSFSVLLLSSVFIYTKCNMISDVFLEIIPKKIFQTTQNNKCLPVNQVWVSQTSSFFITLAFSMLSQSWKKRRIHSSHNYWFPVSLVDRHYHSLHENLRVFLKTYVLIYFLQIFAFNFPWKTSKSFLMFLEGWKKKIERNELECGQLHDSLHF